MANSPVWVLLIDEDVGDFVGDLPFQATCNAYLSEAISGPVYGDVFWRSGSDSQVFEESRQGVHAGVYHGPSPSRNVGHMGKRDQISKRPARTPKSDVTPIRISVTDFVTVAGNCQSYRPLV